VFVCSLKKLHQTLLFGGGAVVSRRPARGEEAGEEALLVLL
jgi:hypothetical protein